ncbi:MAG: DNA translocase FtsK [Clostridium sp.]|uniref:FtsK/SpoIIIE family DNA translocase n=1 Tax=Clostridium sp. TaxID=1506 RepID=UPI002A85F70E|nr:DNA translocase FtsK [Clostridium sp.]MDY5098194.1 DNA translocase FtsK 4TM domain-containing protein [Clostridium sp.]
MGRKKKNSKSNKVSSNIRKKREIEGILIIALGIINFIAMFSGSDGLLLSIIKNSLFNIVGIGAYLVPFLMTFIGIILIRNKKTGLKNEYLIGGILILNTLLLIQLIFMDNYYTDSYGEAVIAIVNSNDILHGGIIGLSLALPIYKMLGFMGSLVVYIAVYLIGIINLFNISIYDFGSKARNKVKRPKKEKINEDSNGYTPIIETKSPVLEAGTDKEKEEFLKGINNKIKILDFMKNSQIDTDVVDNVETAVTKDNIEVIDSKDKKSKTIDESLKNEINNELNSTIIQKNDSLIIYSMPSVDFLNQNSLSKMNKEDKKELLSSATKLEETLNCFGVDAKVLQVTKGPSVTRFELQPSPGVKVSKIVNLSDDIALSLAAKGVRIEAPIPGKSAIGIEIPNRDLTPVFLREVIESEEFKKSKSNLAFALGKDISGKCIVADLSKMPHLLIAGATGSGKSVCINTLVISILYKYSPSEVKILMVDPKVVELNVYNGIPHLLIPVVTDPKKAAAALNWAVNEMNRRYKLFADNSVRNLEGYNELYNKGKIPEKLPLIVIIVDELADLMMASPHDVEEYIARLAQMARAAGMHLVIATQRPSVDVITGVIKANIPSRISFAVSSQVDSRTILDSSGAEKLLGKGDMLFYPVGEAKPVRIQGAFITEEEVEKVTNFIKNNGEANECTEYSEEILNHIEKGTTDEEGSSEESDELFEEAVRIVVESGQASASFLQRRLRIGYNRAARIMEELEDKRIISERDGSKPRQILKSKDEL